MPPNAEAPARAGVILSAGASRRMGRSKAELPWNPFGNPSYTFLSRVIELATFGCPREPIVIVGTEHAPEGPDSSRIAWVVNPHPERGMFSSVQLGLRFVSQSGAPAATMLFLIDHPLVQRATVEKLWVTAEAEPGRVVVPVYVGERGHPVVLPDDLVDAALEAEVDARLDRLVEEADCIEVVVGDPGIVRDIDRPGDYERFFGFAG